MQPVERLHFYFLSRGISKTKARDEIYVALGRFGPCDVGELAHNLKGVVSLRTIHRTVELFVEVGIAVHVGKELVELQEPFVQHHHHFRCRKCGREVKFWDEVLEERLQKVAEGRWMKLESHQIELRGVCAMCVPA